MWNALKGRHQHISAGSRFFHLRTLMSMSVSNNEDISSHIIEIGTVGACLCKRCKNGLILVDDTEKASLIASLPESFTAVTSPFEKREDVSFSEVCVAVKGHVVTRKNRANQTAAVFTSSTANISKSNSDKARSNQDTSSEYKGKNKIGQRLQQTDSGSSGPGPCTYCKGLYHDVSTCLQKKNEEVNKKLENILKQLSSGKSNLETHLDSDSDFTDSTARSATSLKVS